MVKSIKGNEKDSSVRLANTTLKSRHVHVCGMLYDESYAKGNKENVIIVNVIHDFADDPSDPASVLVYVSCNLFMYV